MSDPLKILLIGATSTIAGDIARLYSARKSALYLVGRNETALKEQQLELGDSVMGIGVYDFNVTSLAANAMLEAEAVLGGLDLAVICHGYLGNQEASEHDLTEAEAIIATNFVSVVAQLLLISRTFEKNGRGHIAVIGSVAGDRGRPRNYTYGSAKGALALYLQGLRSRLWGRVIVTTIKLGPVATQMTTAHKKNASFITSPKAAERIVRAIDSERGGEFYVPGFWRAVLWVVRNLPEALFQRLKFLSSR